MEDRESLIRDRIMADERIETMQLKFIKQKVWEILTKEKGFAPEQIERDPEFRLITNNCEFTASIDFIVNIPFASFMVIKCAPAAIESWERYTISLARVIKDYQIPCAVVTDGCNARIIDVLTTSLVGESVDELFNRQEAINKMKDFKKILCPADRLEKEKRIVFAFEGIKCPTLK